MASPKIMVGLPLEKPRSAGRGGWKKWSAQPPASREPGRQAGLARPPAAAPSDPAARPDDPPELEVRPLPLLPIRHFLVLSAVALAAVLLVLGLVYSNHLSVALSYEISALTQEKLALQETNRQLKTELARVGSLAQLEEAARNILGLITPNQGQIVVIDP